MMYRIDGISESADPQIRSERKNRTMFTLLRNLCKYCQAAAERTIPVLILGVDNAGKTTLLSSLMGGMRVVAVFGPAGSDGRPPIRRRWGDRADSDVGVP